MNHIDAIATKVSDLIPARAHICLEMLFSEWPSSFSISEDCQMWSLNLTFNYTDVEVIDHVNFSTAMSIARKIAEIQELSPSVKTSFTGHAVYLWKSKYWD